MSRADPAYPQRLKTRLGEDAPPVLYGCGDAAILDAGGLAVVGSRNVNDTLIEYTEEVGRLTAAARRTLISGGARGIDQAAMRGALEAGGNVVGMLADGLEKAVVRREHRAALMDGRLVLMCPYDPAARFHVGHAMQRNKLIYASADAALVVSSDYGKGGTWTGAIEQLEQLKFVPVYVRADGDVGRGLDELRKRGAKPWPNPGTQDELKATLDRPCRTEYDAPEHRTLSPGIRDESRPVEGDRQVEAMAAATTPEPHAAADVTPANELFAKVRELLDRMDGSRTDARIAEELQVTKKQAEVWLKRFVEEKLRELFESTSTSRTVAEVVGDLRLSEHPVRSCMKRLRDEGVVEPVPRSRPVRYRSTDSIGPLFDRRG